MSTNAMIGMYFKYKSPKYTKYKTVQSKILAVPGKEDPLSPPKSLITCIPLHHQRVLLLSCIVLVALAAVAVLHSTVFEKIRKNCPKIVKNAFFGKNGHFPAVFLDFFKNGAL